MFCIILLYGQHQSPSSIFFGTGFVPTSIFSVAGFDRFVLDTKDTKSSSRISSNMLLLLRRDLLVLSIFLSRPIFALSEQNLLRRGRLARLERERLEGQGQAHVDEQIAERLEGQAHLDERIATAEGGDLVFYEWNIFWKNSDRDGVANKIKSSSANKIGRMPDIIGLCESGGLGDLGSFAQKLGDYKWQSGSRRGYPYGTEIFYSTKRFTELEGIKTNVNFCNSKGGNRGANAVALKERESGQVGLFVDGSCWSFKLLAFLLRML